MGTGVFTYSVYLFVILEIISTDACSPRQSDSSFLTKEVGSSHQFFCSYSSCSENQILSWSVDGVAPSSNLVTTSYSTGLSSSNSTIYNGTSSFTYTPTRPTSSSKNTVTVTCQAGSRTASVNVTINYGPDDPVLNTTGTLNVTEYNSTPHITCQSSCNPQCDYKFSKNFQRSIRSSGSFGIFYESSVRRNDDGIYRCIATNKVGNRTSSGSFRLNVLYPPAFILTRSPSSGQVEEGTSVSFSFRATEPGNPSTYTFRECDHSVDGTSLRNIPYSEVPSRISFTIQNVSITDRGRYTCRVTNNITNQNGGSIVENSILLEVKTPPLILMKTKTVRRSGNNFSLSVDFISLTYVPEVHWFRVMEGQTGETAVNNEINRISYAIVKNNITFSIPSYITKLNTRYPGRYISYIKNYMGAEIVEYVAGSNGSSDDQSEASTALVVVGSLFLVLGIICLGLAVFLYYNLKKTREKVYKERHASLFILPSASALNPSGNENVEGEVNPMDVELTIQRDEDSSPGIVAPSLPTPSVDKKCKERKQNDRRALYENTEMKTSSDNKYVTLTTDQPPVPLYETPHTLTDEIKLKFNKKDKHPYANEKPKKQKKPDTKVKSYANINFRKGKAKTYENHEPGS